MTSDFQALWAALLAAPDDNGLKLILADWLADHDADPDLEAGLRLCAYHGIFPHKTTSGSWCPGFPWRWGTGGGHQGGPWPDSAVPPKHLLFPLAEAKGLCPDKDYRPPYNRTVHHDPLPLVRWLAWADRVAKSQDSPSPVVETH